MLHAYSKDLWYFISLECKSTYFLREINQKKLYCLIAYTYVLQLAMYLYLNHLLKSLNLKNSSICVNKVVIQSKQ